MDRILEDTKSVKHLAEKLNQFNSISKFDSENESEAWTLAHSLSDLERSFREVLDNYLPALCQADAEENINDILLDIGEEFRHILYHINDPKFFRYLVEE
jgi:hypothetical protein